MAKIKILPQVPRTQWGGDFSKRFLLLFDFYDSINPGLMGLRKASVATRLTSHSGRQSEMFKSCQSQTCRVEDLFNYQEFINEEIFCNLQFFGKP